MKNSIILCCLAVALAGCAASGTYHPAVTITPRVGNVSAGDIDSIQRTYHLKDLQRVTLKANGHDIAAWVMDTVPKQEEGMMYLTAQNVTDDDGMIFVFPAAKPQSFWMKNTILELDVIYIGADKKVVSIADGKPQDLTPLPSKGNAQFVLEMKAGAAKRLGIKVGTDITIPEDVKAKDS